jgi:PAS domain-containing protein
MRMRRSTVQRKAAAIALSLRTDIICPIDQMNSYPESSNNLDLKQYTIDHVLDGIYWCDEQARILDVNDSACKMVGEY